MQEPTLTDAQRDLLRGRGISTDRTTATPPQGTGYFSVLDNHELNQAELENSNMVIGVDGFVYQPILENLPNLNAAPGEPLFTSQMVGFELAPQWVQEEVLGIGASVPGASGPTAAELAIERSRVQAQNLSTFIQGTIAELSTEIDAGRLQTEQALGEFNKRLDAFSTAGTQFVGIQPYTVTPGSKYLPGRQPGGVGERLGRPVQEADPVMFDPFAIAAELVAESPSLTDIGVPATENDALTQALELAKSFIGG